MVAIRTAKLLLANTHPIQNPNRKNRNRVLSPKRRCRGYVWTITMSSLSTVPLLNIFQSKMSKNPSQRRTTTTTCLFKHRSTRNRRIMRGWIIVFRATARAQGPAKGVGGGGEAEVAAAEGRSGAEPEQGTPLDIPTTITLTGATSWTSER